MVHACVGAFCRLVLKTERDHRLVRRLSVQLDACVYGPQPIAKTRLMLISPLKQFDLDRDTDIGIAKGCQRWIPGTQPKLKVVNRSTGPPNVEEGVLVATTFATNCDDVERMLLLKKPLPANIWPSTPPVDVVPVKGPAREDPGYAL